MFASYLKLTTDANSFQAKALLHICNLFASEGIGRAIPVSIAVAPRWRTNCIYAASPLLMMILTPLITSFAVTQSQTRS
jgi:hypothetical protein